MYAFSGEMSIIYLFTRKKFNWSESEFSFYAAYSMGLNLVGTIFSISVLSNMFKLDDALIGSMTTFSKFLSSLVYVFSRVEWHMYMGPIAEIMFGAAYIAMRSLASKVVSSDELGQLNSLFGIIEAMAPLIYSPVLNAIYWGTLKKMSSAFFLFSGIMAVPGALLFMYVYIEKISFNYFHLIFNANTNSNGI